MRGPIARSPEAGGLAQAYAVLYPAVAEAASRVDATAIGLVDLGRPAGRNLRLDQVGITYSSGQSLGDPSSPVQVTAALVGGRTVPARALPEVVARVVVEPDPAGALARVADAVARVPVDALPVVITTWALSRLPAERRPRLLDRLGEAAAGRPVAWVSAEGVGVAPAIPTLGDRHASGHSIVGLALFEGPARHAEALGRCWSRGRWLAWLADAEL
jgi:hypothetical protein